jgi:uncharacterized sulfatase
MNKKIKNSQSGIFILGTFFLAACSTPTDKNDPERPNILFAISDDQSFAHTSFLRCKFVNTPAFDRVASEGIYFSNCFVPSPGCAPSRSALVTGRHHWQNEQSGQHGSSWLKKHVPFIDLLEEGGYATGRTGKGVVPFRYASDEKDSLWRTTDAAGPEHSNIRYNPNAPGDERTATEINTVNYFENFKFFMEQVRGQKPFFFWYGGWEPHRDYEKDAWKRAGKSLEVVEVPGFLPDNEIIRGDLLDYALEIEWFDLHLHRMLEYLEEIGELDNTIVIVTADNGMPFPRAKANCYEYGVHVPLAIRYPAKFPGKRKVEDFVSFIDIAPTLFEITQIPFEKMLPMTGRSILKVLESKKQGLVDKENTMTFFGRERHSSSRFQNWGYPQRAIRTEDFLFIWNIKPERWPAGAPQALNPENPEEMFPMYGIDENGIHHSDWAFTDIDASPTKSFIAEHWKDENIWPFFELAHSKRPEFELYDSKNDPFNLINLSGRVEYEKVENELKELLIRELERSGDPRVVGPDREIFDSYARFTGPMRLFPKPKL